MPTLSMVLAGPLQAWGTGSDFIYRGTESAPSFSGVVGLLAAVSGRRRSDPIEDLTALRLGVRVDQGGSVLRDFHTAELERPAGGALPTDRRQSFETKVTYRDYLADARFLVAVEGARELLEGLAEALRFPTFQPYLGRRSCPPSEPIVGTVHDGRLTDVLRTHPWVATPDVQKHETRGGRRPVLEVRTDLRALAGTDRSPMSTIVRQHDIPLSFDQTYRRFDWRTVVVDHVPAPGLLAPQGPGGDCDFFEEL